MKPSLRLSAFAVCLIPATAWANTGIGFLMVSIPTIVIALVPVIFIEAPVLSRMLGLPLRRGLDLSARANFRSTWLGAVIALVVDLVFLGMSGSSGMPPHRGTLVFSLLLMFFLTWWIEHRYVAQRLPEVPRPRIRRATLVANLVSYAVLVALIVGTPLFRSYDQMGYRDQFYSVVNAAQPWKEKVEAYWAQHKRLPERSADIGIESSAPRHDIRSIGVQAGGAIVVELRVDGDAEVDGKKLIFTPQVNGGAVSGWQCRAPGLPDRFTPVMCKGVP